MFMKLFLADVTFQVLSWRDSGRCLPKQVNILLMEIPLQKENCTVTHEHCAEGLDVRYKTKGLNQNVAIRKV